MDEIILLFYMLLLGFFDAREKKVPLVLLAAGSVLALGVKLWSFSAIAESPKWIVSVILLGAMPGIFMIGVSWLTGKAGIGDGWALLNFGLFTDYKTCIAFWGASMFIMAVISAGLLAFRKVKCNTRLPYLPFLALVYLINVIYEKIL